MVGCSRHSSPPIPLIPVTGTVLSQGKGVPGVQLVLVAADASPSNPTDELTNYYPHGVTDAAGRFELSTFVAGDGAPLGNWIVTMTWPDERVPAAVKEQLLASGDQLPDRLRGRYASRERSKFKVKITESPTTLPTLHIETR